MKKIIIYSLRVLGVIFLLGIIYYLINFYFPVFHNTDKLNEGKIILSTKWGGSEAFAKYAPEHNSLGCWSNAFAQIFYHHKLQPFGKVKYQCSKGYKIDENFDLHQFDWDKFVNEITDSTQEDFASETAKYCYFIATIVQKDFGRGRYITKLMPIDIIENHINVKSKLYLNYNGFLFSKRKFKNIVIREIESNRPVFLYYRNMNVSGSGHAVVIDGYKFDGKNFLVHLNFGWGGYKNGWFDLFKSIAIDGDTQLRILITTKPKK